MGPHGVSLAFPRSIAQPNRFPNQVEALTSAAACGVVRDLLQPDGIAGSGTEQHDYQSTLADQAAF